MAISIKDMTQFPMMVIGTAVTDFKKVCEYPIIQVRDINSLREVVSYYTSIKELDRPLIIEDISFLPRNAEGLLLKFVEETSLKLILLSVYDVSSAILMSRIKRVVKRNNKTQSKFLSIPEGSKKLEELSENTSYYDKLRVIGENSPKLYYLDKKVGVKRNKHKIMSILE